MGKVVNHPTDRDIGSSSSGKSDSDSGNNLFADLFTDSSFETLDGASDTFSADISTAQDSLSEYRNGSFDSASTAELFDSKVSTDGSGTENLSASLNLPEVSLFDTDQVQEPQSNAIAENVAAEKTAVDSAEPVSDEGETRLDRVEETASKAVEYTPANRRELVENLEKLSPYPETRRYLTLLSERYSKMA